jgi:hypothetical protein
LLKLEDSASNMAKRSLLVVWMDAVIRALRIDFAKDMESTIVAMSLFVESRIQPEYVPISLFFD